MKYIDEVGEHEGVRYSDFIEVAKMHSEILEYLPDLIRDPVLKADGLDHESEEIMASTVREPKLRRLNKSFLMNVRTTFSLTLG